MAEGYDIYVLAVQEAASEDVFDAMEQRLSMQGLVRLNLADANQHPSTAFTPPGSAGGAGGGGSGGGGSGNGGATDGEEGDGRPDFIYGRGDGSILSSKFTGIAIFVREALLTTGRVQVVGLPLCAVPAARQGKAKDGCLPRGRRPQVCRVANQTVHLLTSKGGCGAALLVDGQTMVFVSCHLEAANKFEERRAQ